MTFELTHYLNSNQEKRISQQLMAKMSLIKKWSDGLNYLTEVPALYYSSF